MKKIAKLTWLHNGNFGSILQAVALQKFLLDNGYNVTDIDYKPTFKDKIMNWAKSGNSPKLFIGKFEAAFKSNNHRNSELFEERNRKIESFKKGYLKCTKVCHNKKQLVEETQSYDIFICGSDQIWSPALFNPAFYLDFVPNEKIKIAYAPSLGVINTTDRKKEWISKLLRRFNDISVREEEGKAFVKKLIDKDVPVVVDPTMLIDADVWRKYANYEEKFDKPYIFCYILTPNSIYIEAVKKLAKKKKMKVVIVPSSKGPFGTGFAEKTDVGPAEWLGLIANAQFICTDSFHGCIFSILFHKEFVLFKRFSDQDKASENSRIYTLTKMLEIENRIIDTTQIKNIEDFDAIDFDKTDSIIKKSADKSKEWLLQALKNAGA